MAGPSSPDIKEAVKSPTEASDIYLNQTNNNLILSQIARLGSGMHQTIVDMSGYAISSSGINVLNAVAIGLANGSQVVARNIRRRLSSSNSQI